MSVAGKALLGERALIKTVNDELKDTAQIGHSRHRSFNNNSLKFSQHYCFFERNAIDASFINDGQLKIFHVILSSR